MRDPVMCVGCSILGVLALSACGRFPESYAVPEQRPNFDDPERWERMIRMNDVDARDHFVADIFEPLAGNWRLTGKRPTIRLKVPPHAHRKYRIEFVISEASFKVAGPVTLTFLVGEHALERKPYGASGPYVFEKDVPPEWLPGGEVRLGAEIDKMFVAKENGRTYGFQLIGIGLKRN